jgi:hypothetical protein
MFKNESVAFHGRGLGARSIVRRCTSTIVAWWVESFYGLMVFAFLGLVVYPLFSSTAVHLKDGVRLWNEEELVQQVNHLDTLVGTAGADRYFDILYLNSDLNAQCHAHIALTNNWYAVGYGMASRTNPCVRVLGGDVGFKVRQYQYQHLGNHAFGTSFNERKEVYLASHPEHVGDLGTETLTETSFRSEYLWEAYSNGVCLTSILLLFIYRRTIRDRGFKVVTLYVTPAAALWPVSITLLFVVSGARAAQESRTWKLAGGVGVVSRYILDNGNVFNAGPSARLWGELSHETGLYVGTWSSLGLVYQGSEVDVTLGMRHAFGDTLVDLSYSYYRFIDIRSGMHSARLKACYSPWSLCGKVNYLVPDDSATPGVQFGVWWSKTWEELFNVTTMVGYAHTRDVFDAPDANVFKGGLSVPIPGTNATLGVTGYVPIEKKDAQMVLEFSFAF